MSRTMILSLSHKMLVPIYLLFHSGRLRSFLVIIFCCTLSGLSAQDPDLQVLSTRGKPWLRFSDASDALDLYLLHEAEKLFGERDRISAGIDSGAAAEERRKEVRKILDELVGPEDRRSPLNARITGTLRKDGYTAELLVFESLPGFYVTGSLFIPDEVQKPAPAVLFCSGHSAQAFRRDLYQIPLLNLVKKGFVVLAIDPLGQGERMQYPDPETGESLIGSSTREHSYPMVQSALIGKSVAEYFILDGIRAIDYLISRPEVDPDRIGVHGLSGGGTQTAYISAMDDRVKAAAPSGYITNFRRLFESIGVQDGEQNFYHGIQRGLDHPELLLAGAPKPLLIMSTTRDFFSIEGTRETYQEMRRMYALYDREDEVHMVEGDKGHGYTQNIREAMYGFFQKYLENPGDASEEEVELIPEEELQMTPTGQVSSSLQSKTVYDLVRERSGPYIQRLEERRKDPQQDPEFREKVREVSGYQTPSGTRHPFFTGRIQREEYSIEKYFIEADGDRVIPFLVFYPERKNGETILYLHPEGKEKEAGPGQKIEGWVAKGYTVVAPDLLGLGELRPGSLRGDAVIDGVSYNAWFTGMAIGRSITGIRAGEVSELSRVLNHDFGFERIHAVSEGEAGPVLLHAAAFEDSFRSVNLVGSVMSWQSFLENKFYEKKYVPSVVPGALLYYDLPDLAAALAPTQLSILRPKDATGRALSQSEIKDILSPVFRAYEKSGNPELLHVTDQPGDLFFEENK